MKQYNGEKYIVSFTSFGQRFDDACKMICALQKQTYKDWHLVMTIYEGDMKDITPNLQMLIDNNLLEVIVAPENLCPHLKYFYAMKKYWDKPIIILDDDRLYEYDVIKVLVEKYESLNYKSIISNCAPQMIQRNGKVIDRRHWCVPQTRLKPNQKSFIAMAEGFAGVLYPPNCFENLDNEIPNIKKCLYDDDLYLKIMAIKNKIPVTQTNTSPSYSNDVNSIEIPSAQEFDLAKHHNAPMQYRADITNLFNKELIKGFSL